jgi:predicted enzyme related to lactoylglutathione lyase
MNKVVHFEIPFDDKARAMKFYSETFGWKLTDIPEMSYVMAVSAAVDDQQQPKEPGAINGGLFQRPKEAPHPTLYVAVDSIDKALEKVKAAGGKVVTPNTPIPGMGAYARIADTEGNVVGLFQTG